MYCRPCRREYDIRRCGKLRIKEIIEEEKIAEMMFDIWHNSDSLKNPVMVGEYIANKLKEAINYTRKN